MLKAQQHYSVEQIVIYKTEFFSIVTAISCALLAAMNESLHAVLVKISPAEVTRCFTAAVMTSFYRKIVARANESEKAPYLDYTVDMLGQSSHDW